MSARRCSDCGISYPSVYAYTRCKVCEQITDYVGDDPDPDWEDTVALEKAFRERERRAQTGDMTIPNVTTVIASVETGQEFVTHRALLFGGYRHLETFDVVKLNGKYYELQGHVVKGYEDEPDAALDCTGGVWWIEEIDPAEYFKDVPVLGPEEYEALEERRGAEPIQ